ncbi:MAG: hypothetical protein ACR2P1_19015 [Pseudomonadales bacterium]
MALLLTQHVAANDRSETWYRTDANGEITLKLYFFWSTRCPHCATAQPFVAGLAKEFDWLEVESAELVNHPENVPRFIELAKRAGQNANAVPAFIFCEQMLTGYDSDAGMGEFLLSSLFECRNRLLAVRAESGAEPQPLEQTSTPEPVQPLTLPLLGKIDPSALSLPALTVIIAALDAFNPCAFFVLLFLLSLLVHARSRARMALIGTVFVIFSGLVYFVFMAAWLNVFMFIGELRFLTSIAGLIAVGIAMINIKDYFWFKRGVSLSIPEHARPGLFARMRALVNARSLPAMLIGTVVLALVANSYELLCTAGFPLVYTRILTLNALPGHSYYLYLLAYNVIYVIPLALIVGVLTFTLGARKLSEQEGRILKLASGLMMLGLGLLLVFAPQLLNNMLVALLLLMVAVKLTALIVWLQRRHNRSQSAR